MPRPLIKTKHIMARLSPEDHATIKAKAMAAGMPASEFLRRAGLAIEIKSPVPEVNIDAWVDLARSAGLMNQLAKRLNEAHVANASTSVDFDQLFKDLRQMSADIAEVRRLLLEGGADDCQ